MREPRLELVQDNLDLLWFSWICLTWSDMIWVNSTASIIRPNILSWVGWRQMQMHLWKVKTQKDWLCNKHKLDKHEYERSIDTTQQPLDEVFYTNDKLVLNVHKFSSGSYDLVHDANMWDAVADECRVKDSFHPRANNLLNQAKGIPL